MSRAVCQETLESMIYNDLQRCAFPFYNSVISIVMYIFSFLFSYAFCIEGYYIQGTFHQSIHSIGVNNKGRLLFGE
jgi:hypothetical protein